MDSWILFYPVFIFFHHYYHLFWCSDGPGMASVSPLQLAPVSFTTSPLFLEHDLIFWHKELSQVWFLFFLPQPRSIKWRKSGCRPINCCKVTAPPCISSHLWVWAFLPCLRFSSSADQSSRPLLFFHRGCCLLCRCLQEFLVCSKHCSLRHCDVFTLNIFLLTLSIGSFGQNSFIWT